MADRPHSRYAVAASVLGGHGPGPRPVVPHPHPLPIEGPKLLPQNREPHIHPEPNRPPLFDPAIMGPPRNRRATGGGK